MIGELPESVEINGKEFEIEPDFRIILTILSSFEDGELNPEERAEIMLNLFYSDPGELSPEDLEEALKKAVWFIDGGDTAEEEFKPVSRKPVMSWTQDEKMIFSAVNSSAGFEVRAVDYLHWWTFLSYFSAVSESLFTTVVSIREKINEKGINGLEKWEAEFYKKHKKMITIETKAERAEKDAILEKLGFNPLNNKQ